MVEANSSVSVWDEILENTLLEEKKTSVLLLFGNPQSGKSNVVQKFQRFGDKNKANTCELYQGSDRLKMLDYAYISVCNNETFQLAETYKCNVWILDDPYYITFLQSVVSPNDVNRLGIMICVNLMEPWTLIYQLETWLKLSTDFVRNLINQLSFDEQEKLRQRMIDQMKLQTSIDLEKSQSDVSEKDKQEVTPPIKLNDSKDAKETKNESDDDKACEVSNNSLKESENDTEQIVQEHTMPEKKTSGNVEDASVPGFIFSGVPIFFCITNSNSYENLNTIQHPGMHHVVLAHIRRVALRYGASICYLTNLEDTGPSNLATLHSYCFHRLLDLSFNESVKLEPPDSIFIPSGWDTNEKLQNFIKSTITTSLDTPLQSLLPLPETGNATSLHENTRVISVDEFLKEHLKKNPALVFNEKVTETNVESAPATTTSFKDVEYSNIGQDASAESYQQSKDTMLMSSRPKVTKSHTSREDTESLQNFFKMLLTKHATGSSTARYSKHH